MYNLFKSGQSVEILRSAQFADADTVDGYPVLVSLGKSQVVVVSEPSDRGAEPLYLLEFRSGSQGAGRRECLPESELILTSPLHLIYFRGQDARMLLSRKAYLSWREIQEEFERYLTSMYFYSPSALVEFLEHDYRSQIPEARRQMSEFLRSGEETVFLKTDFSCACGKGG